MSQSSQFHEVYAHLRDHPRNSERAALTDALDAAERKCERIRAQLRDLDVPPGRAPLPVINPIAPPRKYPAPTLATMTKRAHVEQLQRDIAALGGSLTVRPAPGSETVPFLRHF